MPNKDQRRNQSPVTEEQIEAVRQGATPDRTERDFQDDGHEHDAIDGAAGTGGSSGTGGAKIKTRRPGDVSGIEGAHGRSNIDRETGEDFQEAMESPDARRAGKTRRQADEQGS